MLGQSVLNAEVDSISLNVTMEDGSPSAARLMLFHVNSCYCLNSQAHVSQPQTCYMTCLTKQHSQTEIPAAALSHHQSEEQAQAFCREGERQSEKEVKQRGKGNISLASGRTPLLNVQDRKKK